MSDVDFDKLKDRERRAAENPAAEIVKLHEEIDKLRWQLRQVANVLTGVESQLAFFVVAWDISRDELVKIHDVFEAQEQVLKVKNALLAKPNWEAFEKALVDIVPGRDGLDASQIIWPIYHNGQWKKVIEAWWDWARECEKESVNESTG